MPAAATTLLTPISKVVIVVNCHVGEAAAISTPHSDQLQVSCPSTGRHKNVNLRLVKPC